MAKLKLPFELEKPSANEVVTQAHEIGTISGKDMQASLNEYNGLASGFIANKYRTPNTEYQPANANGFVTNAELIDLVDNATYQLHADVNTFVWIYGFDEGGNYVGGVQVNSASFTSKQLTDNASGAKKWAFYVRTSHAGVDEIPQSEVNEWYISGNPSFEGRLAALESENTRLESNVSSL